MQKFTGACPSIPRRLLHGVRPTTPQMDAEEQIGLLATTPEYLESVKVFPLIPHILKDAMVCVLFRSLRGGAETSIFP